MLNQSKCWYEVAWVHSRWPDSCRDTLAKSWLNSAPNTVSANSQRIMCLFFCSLRFKAFVARTVKLNCHFAFPPISVAENCSRILVAYWTTRCVKGFLSFNPLAFTPVDVTTSKLCEDLIFGNSVWGCVYKICGFISVKKFGYVVGVFLPRKFIIISENFKLVSQRK
jgi:hypothetical protein